MEQLSLWATITEPAPEPQLLSPHATTAEACTPKAGALPLPQPEKARAQQQRPNTAKKKKKEDIIVQVRPWPSLDV